MTQTSLNPVVRHLRRLVDSCRELSDSELVQRFAADREERAFAALFRRHGPLVWSVCYSVLHHRHDTEDAFQATFLLLARRAGTIHKSEAVASWLYRVAHRVATKAGQNMARGRVARQQCLAHCQEVQGDQRQISPPEAEAAWRELQSILNEELQRLPEKYRAPFIMCCLEGKTGPEAARQLGWKVGTVTGRLTEARKLLQRRLGRRGVALSSVLAAATIAHARAATVCGALAEGTIKAALAFATPAATTGLISAKSAALVEAVAKQLFMTKVKVATALLLAVGLFAAGAGMLTHQMLVAQETPSAAPQAQQPDAKKEARDRSNRTEPRVQKKDTTTYAGRVLGPDGRPVAGAKLYLHMGGIHWQPPHERPITGPDGHFQFAVPKAEYENYWTVVTAAAPLYGPGWVVVPAGDKRDNLTLRLVNDDVPITGQIVDLEGKPVADATLRVQRIDAAAGEDLGPWLEATKGKKGPDLDLKNKFFKSETIALTPTVSTDASGHFKLTGIGRNRLVQAQLEGPTIVTQVLHILTRPGETIEVVHDKGNPEQGEPRTFATYYGANFRHVAVPTKPMVGVVRDKDTKKPLAGVTVRGYARVVTPGHLDCRDLDMMRTSTDAQGRYRLIGMPKGEGYKIVAIPANDQPYVVCPKDVPDSPGLDAATVDFELKRGVWIEGKITDKVTGKSVKTSVEYFSVYSNPHLRDYEGFDSAMIFRMSPSKEDGSYRVVGIPGPGLLVVWRESHYLLAEERDDEEGVDEAYLKKGQAPYHLLPLANYGALAKLDLAMGPDPAKRDVTLDPGWTFTGTVLGPDGKPLGGTRGFGLGGWDHRQVMKKGEFTVSGFNPHRPHDIYFQHLEKGLVGVAQPPKENGGAITVQMTPGATVTGRLVDADGQPRADIELELQFHQKARQISWPHYSGEPLKTDSQGRFRIEMLLPGWGFRLSNDKGEFSFADLRSGQTKDLGDVRMKGRKE